ncbi:MAG: hypothetical protein E6Q88_13760, partial [Lysobacteraceae bacterium]
MRMPCLRRAETCGSDRVRRARPSHSAGRAAAHQNHRGPGMRFSPRMLAACFCFLIVLPCTAAPATAAGCESAASEPKASEPKASDLKPRASASTPAVYPPNWWVGMRDPRLQLMLRGPDIALARATLADDARARIVGVVRGDSPNYLFVDLRIDARAAPGDLVLRLAQAGKTRTLRYPLLA